MASSLLDSLTALAGPNVVNTLASKLGEPNQAVSKGLTASFGAILAGLLGKASDGGGLQQIMDMVRGSTGAARVADNPSQLTDALPQDGHTADTGGALSSIVGGGEQLLGSLFGGQSSAASGLVAQASGLKPAAAGSIMTFAAPLVLGLLNKRMASGDLNAGNFASTLSSERDSIMRAAPAGIGNVAGMLGSAREAAGRFTGTAGAAMGAAAATPVRAVNTAKSGGNKWLIPLIIILVLLALLWFFMRRNDGSVTTGSIGATADSIANRAESAANRVGDAMQSAAGRLGAFVERRLPNGSALNVPESGVESQLISFIDDNSRAVNDTLWFNFDRLRFQTGSAMLEEDSHEQLENIANIMKAYPNVNLKIGGYTDNTGNAASNLKLSSDRANTVRQAIVDLGVATNRLTAEGYGDAHPVADNSTEEGRAANRRIALRVTQK